jgi:hypothetical protein
MRNAAPRLDDTLILSALKTFMPENEKLRSGSEKIEHKGAATKNRGVRRLSESSMKNLVSFFVKNSRECERYYEN